MRKTALNLEKDWMDFRYTVIDPQKANELLANSIVPCTYFSNYDMLFLLDRGCNQHGKTEDMILHILSDSCSDDGLIYEIAHVRMDRMENRPWKWEEDAK